MTWYNFLNGIAPFIAAGWTLGTFIGYWERPELRSLAPQEKIWTCFWYEKEKFMWIWLTVIALEIIF